MIMFNDNGKRNRVLVKRHKIKFCGHCGRRVYGRRLYCNNAHKQAAWRDREFAKQSGITVAAMRLANVQDDFFTPLFTGVME